MNVIKLALASVAVAAPLAAIAQAPATLAEGQRAYMAAGCYLCHGTIGQGGSGPKLAPKPYPAEALLAFVRGSPRSMPPYDAQLLPERDLRGIHLFLSSIEASPPVEQIPLLK